MFARRQRTEDRGWKIERALRRPSILCLLSSILFCTPLAGCVLVGALTNKIIPQAPVPAQYVPAKNKPMLVLVENYRNPAAAGLDAQRVALHVAEGLRRYRVAPVVDPDAAESLRTRDDYHAMKVQDVGRAAGAQQVLYVNLQQFALDDTVGGGMVKGRAELRVRVVDVASGRTLWPQETPEGAAVTAESPWARTAGGGAAGTPEPALRDQVARSAADQIVKLFRKWRPEDEGQASGETLR